MDDVAEFNEPYIITGLSNICELKTIPVSLNLKAGLTTSSPSLESHQFDFGARSAVESEITVKEETNEPSETNLFETSQSQSRSTLQHHIRQRRSHIRQRRRRFKCRFCQGTFVMQSSLILHCESVHNLIYHKKGMTVPQQKTTPLQTVWCSVCHRRFGALVDLKNHFRKVHQRGLFKCDICQAPFEFVAALYVHKKKKHKGQASEATSDRGNQTQNDKALLTHPELPVSPHTSPPRSSIDNVEDLKHKDKEIISSTKKVQVPDQNLVSHSPAVSQRRVDELDSFRCSTCHMKFLSNISLRNHIRFFHKSLNSKPTVEVSSPVTRERTSLLQSCFQCHVCHESFSLSEQLRKHLLAAHASGRVEVKTENVA